MPEPRRWTLYDQSDDYNAIWWVCRDEREPPPPALKYAEAVEVMPVPEHLEAMAALRAEAQTQIEAAVRDMRAGAEVSATAAIERMGEHLARAVAERDEARAELAKAREIIPAKIQAAARKWCAIVDGPDTEPDMQDLHAAKLALMAALGQEERDDG